MAARPDKLKPLRDKLEKALSKGKLSEAETLLKQLVARDSKSARWPHKLGDVYRRMGQSDKAVSTYFVAVERYAQGGLLARAVAMAKTVTSIDPSRKDVLALVQQEPARALQQPTPITTQPPIPVSAEMALALEPARDEADDEVRFVDVAQPLDMEIDLLDDDVLEFDLDDLTTDPEQEALAAQRMTLLPSFALFADLPREAMLVLAERSTLVELEPGAPVIRRGDVADSLYAIVRGSVRVEVSGPTERLPLASLAEGEIFGEACLLNDEPRTAAVTVEKRLSALKTPKEVLDELVAGFPEVGNVLLRMLTQRLIVNQLKTNALFLALDRSVRRETARLFEIRKAAPGTQVIAAGKRCDGMYIPLTGRLICQSPAGRTTLQPGSVVGQFSLVSRTPSQDTVTADRLTLLLRLSAARFAQLAAQHPSVAEILQGSAPTDGTQLP